MYKNNFTAKRKKFTPKKLFQGLLLLFGLLFVCTAVWFNMYTKNITFDSDHSYINEEGRHVNRSHTFGLREKYLIAQIFNLDTTIKDKSKQQNYADVFTKATSVHVSYAGDRYEKKPVYRLNTSQKASDDITLWQGTYVLVYTSSDEWVLYTDVWVDGFFQKTISPQNLEKLVSGTFEY